MGRTSHLGSAFKLLAYGQVGITNELKIGILISRGGVRSVWPHHDLKRIKERLKALEARVALEGGVLLRSNLMPLRNQLGKSHGPSEMDPGYLPVFAGICPGYVLCWTLKGVGPLFWISKALKAH